MKVLFAMPECVPHPSGIRSAVTSEFHRAGITQITRINSRPDEIGKEKTFHWVNKKAQKTQIKSADYADSKNEKEIATEDKKT